MKYIILLHSLILSVACSGGGGGSSSDSPPAKEKKSPSASFPASSPSSQSAQERVTQIDSFSLKSPSSNIAQDSEPSLRFEALTPEDVVSIYSDNSCSLRLAQAKAQAEQLDVKVKLSEDGVYKFYATRSRTGLAESQCSSFFIDYSLDRAISDISGISVVSDVSNDATPVVTVVGSDEGDSVYLFTDPNCLSSSQIGFGIAAQGATEITLSSAALKSDASYDFYARSSDVAGNQSSCSSSSARYQLDTQAPDTPHSLVLNSVELNSTSPAIQVGGLTLGNKVTLYKDSNCSEIVADMPISNISMNVTSSKLESDGIYQFHATQTDEAGNVSACSSDFASYSLDASNPSLSEVSFDAGGLNRVAVNGEATLKFISSEPLKIGDLVVSIHGNSVSAVETSPKYYQAKYQFKQTDPSASEVSFSINYLDLADNSGPEVHSTSNGEKLSYDNLDFSPSVDIEDHSLSEKATLILDINDSKTSLDVDGGNEAISYSCYYDSLIDSRVADSLSCNLLGVSLDAANGKFSWTPNYSQSGDYELKIVASDGTFKGESIFKVSVSNLNRMPVISQQGNKKLSENQTFTKNFRDVNTNSDNDIDGDIITYTCFFDDNIDGIVAADNLCSEISGLNFNEVSGLFSWSVKPSNAGIYDVKVVASDGLMSDETIFKVTVTVDISKQPQLSMVGNNDLSYFSSLSDNNEVTLSGVSLGVKNAGDTFQIKTNAGDLLQCSGGCFAMTPIDGTAAWSTKTYAATLLSTYVGRESVLKVVVAAFENPAYVVIKQRNVKLKSANIAANSIHIFTINDPVFEALVIESDQDVSAYVSSGSSGDFDKDGRVITAASKQSLGFVSGGGGTPSGITTTVDNTLVNAYRADGVNFLNETINLDQVLVVTQSSVSQNDWPSAIAIYSNQPTVSTQHADSDGNNATPSLPKSMLSTHFVTPMEGDYVSFAAYEAADVIVIDSNDDVIAKLSMQKDPLAHEKSPYAISYNLTTPIPTGTKFICSEPCLAIFEPETIDDETLMTGALNDPFTMTSNDFTNDSKIPSAFEAKMASCSGENSFPHLQWDKLPWGTKSLVLIVENESGDKLHLNLSNIDPSSNEIPKLTAGANFPSGSLGSNGFGVSAWTGVCSSSVDEEYSFKLYALKSLLASPISNMKSADFETTYKDSIIDLTILKGKY